MFAAEASIAMLKRGMRYEDIDMNTHEACDIVGTFTLVELLVVIASSVFSSLSCCRRSSRREYCGSSCISNIKNISLAALNYGRRRRALWPRWVGYLYLDAGDLPYIEHQKFTTCTDVAPNDV
jgi:hypothetical protein